MDRIALLRYLAGALLAGVVAGAVATLGLEGGYAVVAGLAAAMPLLRADTFGGFETGTPLDSRATLVGSLGAFAVGTVTVALLARFTGLGLTMQYALGAGGAFAGSYLGDLVGQSERNREQ